MNKFIILVSIFIISSCNLFEPSYLMIDNNSNYKIIAKINNASNKEIEIEKSDHGFLLCSPGEIDMSISIDDLRYQNEYKLTIGYMEKKEFEFNLE
jgi:hypothetical protein